MSTLFKQPPDILKGKATGSSDILGGKFSKSPPDVLRNTSGPVMSVFGRTGYVIAQAGDYTADLITNAVDQTGRYANPAWITSLDYSKISNAPAPPSIAAYQTPWLQDINAAGFRLLNAASVGIGTSTPLNPLQVVGNPNWVDLPPQPGYGWAYFANNDGSAGLSFGGNSTWGSGAGASWIQASISNGTQRGTLVLQPARGYVGVNQVMPAYQLDVQGDINTTGRYLQNGSPLPGQSPWAQDVDAANHALFNAASVAIGTATAKAQLDLSGSVNGDTPGQNLKLCYSAGGVPLFGWRLDSGNGSLILDRAWGDWAATPALRILRANGYLGVNNANPGCQLDVVGSINCTGQYLQNGVPISSGGGSQSPWTGDVDAAGHSLNDVDAITSRHGIEMTFPYGASAGGGHIRFSNGTSRLWEWTVWNAASGSNAGNDLILSAFDDSGNYLSTPLNISRSTGLVTLGGALNVATSISIQNGAHLGSISITSTDTDPAVAIQSTATGGKQWMMISSAGGSGLGQGTFSIFNYTDFRSVIAAQPGGNVGIGQGSPSYKLDVSGDVNTTGVYRVNGTPVATGGGSVVLLARLTANNTSGILAFPSIFAAGYDTFFFVVEGLVPATNGITVWVRVTADNGSTYDTTSGHYLWGRNWVCLSVSDSNSGQTGDSGMQLWNADLNNSAAFGGLCGQGYFHNARNANSITTMIADVMGENTANHLYVIHWGGTHAIVTALTGFRLETSAGNFVSGSVAVYGVKNS